jgi:hypothetical protein
MAGSNSKETRGLNTKNWANPQIFLNGAGLGVDSRKTVIVRVLVMLDIYFVSVKYVFVSIKLMCVYVKLLKI